MTVTTIGGYWDPPLRLSERVKAGTPKEQVQPSPATVAMSPEVFHPLDRPVARWWRDRDPRRNSRSLAVARGIHREAARII
jgi:hypothetical protein